MAGYEVGSAYLTILPSAKGFSANLNRELDGPFNAAGIRGGDQMGAGVGKSKGFAGAGLAAGVAFAASFAAVGIAQVAGAVKDFLGDAISKASDLSETQSKVGQIFGGAQGKVKDFAKTAASGLGQTQQQALDGAATFGIFAKSAGLSEDASADFSTQMVSLAGDLASFNNTSPEDAINAIGSALRGESEPIRSYGVLLDDATLKNRALALGLITTTKDALTPQQKVLAAHAEILAQTSTQQGDFARTSEGLANQQRIVTAEMENTKAEIGTALLPIVSDLFKVFADVGVPALQDVAAWFTENKEVVAEMALAFVDGALLIVQSFLGFAEQASRMADFWLTIGTNMVQTWLNVVGAILDGAETAFGWVPGLGDKLRSANDKFDAMRDNVDEQFAAMRESADITTQMFIEGQDAVQGLRDKVQALNGSTATVYLNAQGNMVDKFTDGSFRNRGSSLIARATGGPVTAGQPYVVGEREAELFVPDRNGQIYNQRQLAGMMSAPTQTSAGDTFNVYEAIDATATALTVSRIQNARAV